MNNYSHIIEWLWSINKNPEVYSSSASSSYPLKSTLVFDTSNHLNTGIQSDTQWWRIDLKIPVYITGYLIRSSTASTNNGWLYNWSVLASIDNNTFKSVHGPIQDEKEEKAYRLSYPVKARYMQIEGNSRYNGFANQLAFYYVKFFGSPNAPYKYFLSCKSHNNMNTNLIRIILVMCS